MSLLFAICLLFCVVKMLYEWVQLTWWDVTWASLPFITVALLHLCDVIFSTVDAKAPTITRATTEIITELDATPANGKIQKQKSEQNDDIKSTTPSAPVIISTIGVSTPPITTTPLSPTSARNSISSMFSNGHQFIIPHTPSLPETLSDEYHEDEDTLSLENLFPCDQSEIYASKKIQFIIDELIQTEANYVNNLRKGLQNYGALHKLENAPEALQGDDARQQLLGNIEEILLLHEQHILPLMIKQQRDLKAFFDEFAAYFDRNEFYCYVIFMMNKKTSMQLRQEQREWLQNLQNEINDKLGIDSFLVQPIQRLTRYPLLLQQFISEFYKSGISCKPVLMSVCKLETRMRRLLEVVNQAEEIPQIDELIELNLPAQGYFRRSTEFDAYHHRSRKKYRAKLFLFDRCLICAEIRKRRLAYRQHYTWDMLELQLNNSKSVTLLLRPDAKEEYELSAPEAISVTLWLRCARKIIERERVEASQRGKFSLPMDLVLGVAAAIWLIWHYLY